IGWSELLLIGIVALIAIGPKELPTVLRTLGQWMSKLRRMASEFQSQFQEAMREAEMADLKKQVDEMTSQAQSYANFDPVSEVRREGRGKPRRQHGGAGGPPPGARPAPPRPARGAPAPPPRAPPPGGAPPRYAPPPPGGAPEPETADAAKPDGKPA